MRILKGTFIFLLSMAMIVIIALPSWAARGSTTTATGITYPVTTNLSGTNYEGRLAQLFTNVRQMQCPDEDDLTDMYIIGWLKKGPDYYPFSHFVSDVCYSDLALQQVIIQTIFETKVLPLLPEDPGARIALTSATNLVEDDEFFFPGCCLGDFAYFLIMDITVSVKSIK